MQAHELDLLRQVLAALGQEAEIYNGKGNVPVYDGSKAIISTVKLPLPYQPFILALKNSGVKNWFWAYPNNSSKPLFLTQPDIYAASQNTVSIGSKLVIGIGLASTQADEKVYCYSPQNSFNALVTITGDTDFVIHFCSNGRGGNARAYTGVDGKINHQVKIAFNQEGLERLENESLFLKKWAAKLTLVALMPESSVLSYGLKQSGISVLPYIRPKKYLFREEFGKEHILFLNNMYAQSIQKGSLKYAPFWKETAKLVQDLGGWLNHHASNPDCQELPNGLSLQQLISLSDRLIFVWQLLDDMPEILVSQAHNSFNARQCYLANGKFYVQDWEFAFGGLPLFTDLFQFYFQPKKLLEKDGATQIKIRIKNALQIAEAQEMVKGMDLDIELYYLLFLLWHISQEAWKLSRSYKASDAEQDWLQLAEFAIKAEIDSLQKR